VNKSIAANSPYLAPLAGRGRIASRDAIRVRGYRSIGIGMRGEMPLTPNLSPQERGEGADRNMRRH